MIAVRSLGELGYYKPGGLGHLGDDSLGTDEEQEASDARSMDIFKSILAASTSIVSTVVPAITGTPVPAKGASVGSSIDALIKTLTNGTQIQPTPPPNATISATGGSALSSVTAFLGSPVGVVLLLGGAYFAFGRKGRGRR